MDNMDNTKAGAAMWAMTCGCGRQSQVGLVWLALTILFTSAPATANDADHTAGVVSLGEPQILFVADGDFQQGYSTSLAFTQDSKTLIGTLQRNPGSAILHLLGQRFGEVRSFDLTAVNKAKEGGEHLKSTLLMSARNIHYQILTTPSGPCRDPLLFARWHAQLKNVEVVTLRATKNGPKKSVRGRFSIPRNEKMTAHTSSLMSLSVGSSPIFMADLPFRWNFALSHVSLQA